MSKCTSQAQVIHGRSLEAAGGHCTTLPPQACTHMPACFPPEGCGKLTLASLAAENHTHRPLGLQWPPSPVIGTPTTSLASLLEGSVVVARR